ncbi:hypothetical protein V8G54_006364 [Vigna mungo]|uniref:Uncharacterized protein n=1 Tax=Vigna mungo TaxID=3915 RepID=A0AAQ3P218_VIGMU
MLRCRILPNCLISASNTSFPILFTSLILFTTTHSPFVIAALYADPSPPFPSTSAAAFIMSCSPNTPLVSFTITMSPLLFSLLSPTLPLTLATCTSTASSALLFLLTAVNSTRRFRVKSRNNNAATDTTTSTTITFLPHPLPYSSSPTLLAIEYDVSETSHAFTNGLPHRPSFPTNESTVNVARLPGMGPSSLLKERSSDFSRWPKLGIKPEKELYSRWSSLRRSSWVRDWGMVPLKRLPESQSFLREFNGSKKSFGIGPEKRFWVKRRDLIEPSLLNAGIGPEKELLMKLRVLRPRISARASTSIGPERSKSERCRPVMTPLKQTTPSQVPEQGETLGIHEERERSPLTRDCLRRRRDWVSVE